MRIKIYYRKNLKLSPQKLASSCAHIGSQLGYYHSCLGEDYDPQDVTIVVLMASDTKFNEIKNEIQQYDDILSHLHVDKGLTQVEPDTEICFGYIE